MAGYRKNRVNEEMMRVVASVLRQSKDPRIARSLVSVTGVEVSPDLKYAKIFYSFLSKKYEEKEIYEALRGASGFVRSGIAREMNLRITPELHFVRDNSIEQGAKIDDLLRSVKDDLTEKPEESGEEGNG